jgi:hypothetical protein
MTHPERISYPLPGAPMKKGKVVVTDAHVTDAHVDVGDFAG